MEAALVSAATGALKPVLQKLSSLLGEEYKRFKAVRGEIMSLTHELTAMDAFLMKISEEEDPDIQDKVWMNEVRELSYNMEDCIDDFMQCVDGKDAKPDGFIEKIKHLMGKTKARRRIGNEIHDLKKQITQVGERNQRYKTRQAFSSTKNATVDPRALAIFEDVSNLVGIDEPKDQIVKLLNEGASTREQPKLVSIVGPGGIGKTTLANQVYQHLKEKFECRAFLSVSRNPDMMNILRIILSEVTGKDYAKTEAGSIQQLVSKITYFLADKSYFVVVDDIWDVHTWDIVKCAFPKNRYSRVITTTRISDVAEACRASFNGDIYGLQPLSIVHSRKLFNTRLLDSKEDFPSHLEKVSEEILQKCDGLPLAIIAVSGLLANKDKTENLWNQVKDSIGRELERNPGVKRMMEIIALSYFDLPPHLKSCLLYMSIFPEDSFIARKSLIRCWIAEGFIHKEEKYTVHEIGERCLNELLNRGLIQPGATNRYGDMKSCRVHDTILDFIISKSIEENFVTLLGAPNPKIGTQSKVIRRLSLQGVKQGNSTISTSGLVLSHVRSLNVFGDSMEIPSFKDFKHLRVLELEHCNQLEEHHLENTTRFFQLRYLNLKYARVNELPDQIGRLGCLETLDIRGTMVEELPASIVNLGKLSHLLVGPRVKFPDGIGKLQTLEMLKVVGISKQPFDFLCCLGQLNNLRNLVFDGFQVDSDSEDMIVVHEERNKAIVSSLCKLGTQNLRTLTIWEGSSLLQQPLCMVTLEKLITWSSPVPRVPKWLSSLRNLQQLRLEVKEVKQVDLYILGAIPALLLLKLDEVTESTEKLIISGEIGFPSLRIFIYDANFHRADLIFEAGSMPKLEKFGISCLRVVQAESVDFGIENLPSLVTVGCDVYGDKDIVEAAKTAIERAVSSHPNHPTFRALIFSSQNWTLQDT